MLRALTLLLVLSWSLAAQTTSLTQTDTSEGSVNCGTCSSGACSNAQTDTTRLMDEGATAGSSEVSETQAASSNDRMIAFFSDVDGLGVSCDDGTATTRLEVTTAGPYTVTEICICQGTTELGAATGLSISLNSTGVKTQTVTISADSNCSSNAVRVIYCGDVGGGPHGNETVGITPSQDHDIPTAAAVDGRGLLNNPITY